MLQGVMADLNVRNVDASLLMAVNVKAADSGFTQRDFVIRVLTAAVNVETRAKDKIPEVTVVDAMAGLRFPVAPVVPDTDTSGPFIPPAPGDRVVNPKLIVGEKCFCGASVFLVRDPITRVEKWSCTGTSKHFQTPKVRE